MCFGETGQETLSPEPMKNEPDIPGATIPLDAEPHPMSEDHSEGSSTRTRKRPAAKTSIRQTASKVKATLHLSVEASQRLSVHATMLGVDRSELIEQLIRENLKRFVVSDRGGANAGNEMGSPEAA